jgi:hypothetical protein
MLIAYQCILSLSQDEALLLMSECALEDFDGSQSSDSLSKRDMSPPPIPTPPPADVEEEMPRVDDKEEEKEAIKMEDEEKRSETSDLSLESMGSPARPKSTDKLSENEASDTSESCESSKGSSDLTPSESRSNEEVASSMKESDNASSSSGSTGKDHGQLSSESENDSKNRVKSKVSVHKKQDYFNKLFVPMRVWYEDNSQQNWLRDVEMCEGVLYQQQKGQDDTLLMNPIGQPELVRLQMTCLLRELQGSENDSRRSSSLSSREDQAENTLHIESPRTHQQDVEQVSQPVTMDYDGNISTTSMYQDVQSTTSGFSSMSNADSSGRGNSSSGDKNGGSSSNADKTGSGSSKESSVGSQGGSADHSQSSNSDPDDKKEETGECQSPRNTKMKVSEDDSGEGEEEMASGQPSCLPASVIEKLDSVMSVFSLKEALESQHMELLQE